MQWHAILLISVVLSTVSGASASPRRGALAPESLFGQRTTLRTTELSYSYGVRGGQPEVRSISTKVVNVGAQVAKDVQVSASLPGGMRVMLRGPKTIRSRGRAFFVYSGHAPVLATGKVEVDARCSACR